MFKDKFGKEIEPKTLETIFIILSEKTEKMEVKAQIIRDDVRENEEVPEKKVREFVEIVLQLWGNLVKKEDMEDVFQHSNPEKLEDDTGAEKYL